MSKKYIEHDIEQDELFEDEYFQVYHKNQRGSGFNYVIGDVAKVYPNAVLVGAIAASKYIRPPVRPRVTYDVDILLSEADFEMFLADDLPEASLKNMEKYFLDSDSVNHSLRHKSTGIYVDFLSTESTPLKPRLIRHILENRKLTTNILRLRDSNIDIVKPEYLIALKLNRYYKKELKEGNIDLETAKTEFSLCLDIALIIRSERSDEFENYLDKMNKPDDILIAYQLVVLE